jgi:shikimate kinase
MSDYKTGFSDLIPAVRNLILIGMMGSGKSTVGRRLASSLGRTFVDADTVLQARCGVPISTIFELEGEVGFRRREAALIAELAQPAASVLATGGGAVLSPASRALMHELGFVVYLQAPVAELWQRLKRDRTRPLLRTDDPRARIESLVTQRDPLYRQTAHLVVTTGRQPVTQTVADILARLPDDLQAVASDAPKPTSDRAAIAAEEIPDERT